MEGGTSLLDELLAKHQNSAQPESRQLVAVAGAVAEVLAAEGMQPTPTALFAAAMSSLERTEAQGSPEARHSAWPGACCSLAVLLSDPSLTAYWGCSTRQRRSLWLCRVLCISAAAEKCNNKSHARHL